MKLLMFLHKIFRHFHSFDFLVGKLFFYWDRKGDVIEINWDDKFVKYL